MAVVDATIILGLALLMTYLTLHKEHPFLAGLLYILAGGATYLVQTADNPYGLIIIVLGFIRIFTAPFGGKGS